MDQENQTTENENVKATNQKFRQFAQPKIIVLSLLVVAAIGAILIWLMFGRSQGTPVPAPRTVSFDDVNRNSETAPVEDTITLSTEQIEKSGIRIESVGETLSSDAAASASVGVVQPNAYKETPVISLVSGVIRQVNVELGQNVIKGQTVAAVYSDELGATESQYLSLQTEVLTARQNYQRASKLLKINPTGRSEFDLAQARLKSKEAELIEMQRRYRRTVRLVEIGAASREDLDQDQTKLATAEADVEQARRQLERSAQLVNLAPASNADYEQAFVKLRTAESGLAAARQKLIMLGLTTRKVDSLLTPSQISSELALTAPVSGIITAREINVGETIEANKELLKVSNLSTVWVIAQVYEANLGQLRIGSGASITSNAFPGRLFRGQVTYIDSNLNPETRTGQVRIELENPQQILKFGMYVNVAFGALQMAERTMPVVPSAAVQNINSRQIVFAATDSPNTFVMRTIQIGGEKDKKYVVLNGLSVGDRVVVDGSFLLRAEWTKQNPGQ